MESKGGVRVWNLRRVSVWNLRGGVRVWNLGRVSIWNLRGVSVWVHERC